MIKNLSLKIIFVFNFCLSTLFINAQQPSTLKQVIASVDTFNTKLPAEQLYLHFDKKDYAVGDTVWFKAYLFERSSHAYSALSGLLYVELISDKNKLVKRYCFPAAYGVSWGQINLDKDEVAEGNYTMRAYTNWMQNFGEDYFFHQSIVVIGETDAHFLVKENHAISFANDKEKIDFAIQLNDAQGHPENKKEINLKILNGKKVLEDNTLQSGNSGILKGSFLLTGNSSQKDLNIVVEDKNDTSKRSTIPLFINQSQNIDLQFMPEGGYLVAGIRSKVGFKAIDESGMGIELQGKIMNSKNQTVVSFSTLHKGMGVFYFTPEADETYKAVAILADGKTRTFDLPAIKKSGIVLQLNDQQNADSINVNITCSPDFVGKQFYLIALSRGVVCYAANIVFKNATLNASIDKNLFPSGIAHFTLMNRTLQPINERMLFINHADNLKINVTNNANIFFTRDSVPLHVTITDKNNNPVTGSFSMSVTDDAQVKTDSSSTENIVTRMLLTADLKGNIEVPDFYTNNTNEITQQSLDALLLTQGWIGYEWDKIINPPTPEYFAEPQLSVRGKVTNLFNSPINKAHVVLMGSGLRNVAKDTTTNSKGEFIFSNFKKLDSLSFFIDARNKNDKKFGVGLKLDQFKPAEIKTQTAINMLPWYVNSDTALINFLQDKQKLQNENQSYDAKYKRLQEVRLQAKKTVKGSLNLNGVGNADQIIDETEIEKETGKNKNLLDLLKEKVKGFVVIPRGDQDIYKINNEYISFIVDGINLARFGAARETLEYLDAEDVAGIEIMYTNKYTANYKSSFLSLGEQMDLGTKIVFIEITTRSSNGIFFKKLPGITIFKPFPVTLPAQFYMPKYPVNNAEKKISDLRSTIYWNPILVSNKMGEINTFFYAADKPSTYTINIQGSNLNGSVGYKVEKISITKK